MNNDNFTEAARTEAPPVCEHYWISHSQDSALIPWVIRCRPCGAFNTAEMDHLARAHLASQEPTDAEAEAAKVVLDAHEYADEPQAIRDALTVAILPIIRKAQADAWQAGVNFALPRAETTHFARHNPHRTKEDA